MTIARFTSVLVFALASGASFACSSSSSSSDPTSPPAPEAGAPPAPTLTAAEQAFWDAFHAGDTTAGAAAVEKLQAVIQQSPQSSRAAMILGLSAYWLVAENGRDAATSQQVIQKYAPIAGQYVNQAHGMNPEYGFLTSFAGFFTFDQGGQTGNASLAAQGKKLIDQGEQQQPESGFFFELLAAARVPPSDPQEQTAVDDTWKYFELCGGQPMDRTNPDFSAYFAQAEGGSPKQFCGDDTKAPHAEEAIFLFFGDLLAKTGKSDVAKKVYAAGQTAKGYPNWPHKDALAGRVAGGPPTFGDAPYSCTVCHGATAK